jgi:large conductance mechanosensitive channel
VGVLKGFRDFVLRGNVIELAIAVVIGVAFNDLVTAFTADFINPLINRIGGGNVSGKVGIGGKQYLDYGGFITGVIKFLIIAAVLYFVVVLPTNALAERRRRGQAPPAPAEPTEEVVLLTQIRDALVASAPVGAVAPEPRVSQDAAVDVPPRA